MMRGCKDESAIVREMALSQLHYFTDTQSKVAVAALIEGLKDKNTKVAETAAMVLWEPYGSKAEAAVPALVANLKDPARCNHAALALTTVGEKQGAMVVPALIEALRANKGTGPLKRANVERLVNCLSTWAQLKESQAAVPDLVEIMQRIDFRKTDPEARGILQIRLLCAVLEGIGPPAKAAVPSLLRLVQTKEALPADRTAAAQALGKINAAAGIKARAILEAEKRAERANKKDG
jgi:HEAT repeat protein